MPDKFGWPTLPSGARWLDENEVAGQIPPEQEITPKQIESNVGSVYRQIMGPLKSVDAPPSFMGGFVKPVASKAFDLVNPIKDPIGFGLMLASTLLPGGPAIKVMGQVSGKLAPIAETMAMSGLRRTLGMGAAGATAAGLAGQDPKTGAIQGLITQLGSEGARKLTQFASMNAQAKQLAAEDPAALGQVVSSIIPGLDSIRTPKDFHQAFKKSAAQQAVSQAYASGLDQVSEAVGQQPITSTIMRTLRGSQTGASQTISPLARGMGAYQALGQGRGTYSFDDVMETIKRLRTVGYTADEAARGLNAKIARDTASDLESELLGQLSSDQASKVAEINSAYARGQRIIGFLDNPKLFKPNGDLNIPALQKRLKSEGYNVGQSFAIASDAADLEKALFRGSATLEEDIPGKPGKFFGHGGLSGRHGFLSFLPKFPTLPTYAGRDNAGLSPFQSSLMTQLLRKGINDRPNTLRED